MTWTGTLIFQRIPQTTWHRDQAWHLLELSILESSANNLALRSSSACTGTLIFQRVPQTTWHKDQAWHLLELSISESSANNLALRSSSACTGTLIFQRVPQTTWHKDQARHLLEPYASLPSPLCVQYQGKKKCTGEWEKIKNSMLTTIILNGGWLKYGLHSYWFLLKHEWKNRNRYNLFNDWFISIFY